MLNTCDIRPSNGTRLISARSAFGRSAARTRPADNSNRPDRRAAFPFGYDPAAATEGELLAVEAMFLGADILETLKQVGDEISCEQKSETAKLARTLLSWGVDATSDAKRP